MRTWRRRLILQACTRLCLACACTRDCLNGQLACSTAVKVLYSTVATAQLAVHTETESSGFGGNSIRQRAATLSLPDSSKRAVVDKRSSLREESVKRYVHDLSEEFAHPKINVLHLPQHFSQLEARNTDDDNAKQQKRKIEYSSIRSLSHVHQFLTPCSNRRRKGQFSTRPRGTIAVLAQTNAIFSLHNRAAGRGPYILMAEISGHALTDLSKGRLGHFSSGGRTECRRHVDKLDREVFFSPQQACTSNEAFPRYDHTRSPSLSLVNPQLKQLQHRQLAAHRQLKKNPGDVHLREHFCHLRKEAS